LTPLSSYELAKMKANDERMVDKSEMHTRRTNGCLWSRQDSGGRAFILVFCFGLTLASLMCGFIPWLSELSANLAAIHMLKSGVELTWVTHWHWDADGQLTLEYHSQDGDLVPTRGDEESAQAQRYSLWALAWWPHNTSSRRTMAYLAFPGAEYAALEENLSILSEESAQRPWDALALAKLYEWQGKHGAAMEELRRGGSIDCLLSIAETTFSGGQVENAQRLAALAVETAPSFLRTYYLLGHILVLSGTGLEDAEYAASIFGSGLQLQPENTDMRTGLAHALVEAGRYEEAWSHLRIVISKAPDNSTAHLLLGEVYLIQGNWAAAAREYLTCLSLAPDQVWALYGLGRTYVAQERVDDAIAVWQRALRTDPSFEPALEALRTVK
jgi:tetratricopeptide (TPR) repeat protein